MSDDLWGPINPNAWRSVPFITGRCADEADVKAGNAVFYLKGNGLPYTITLPHCAIWSDNSDQRLIPGIIVQAEQGDGKILIGFRPLAGGNVLALLPEFRLVKSPEEFAQ